jgi:hypothetical protein
MSLSTEKTYTDDIIETSDTDEKEQLASVDPHYWQMVSNASIGAVISGSQRPGE